MRRISTLLTIAAGLFVFCGSAQAATVTMKGTVDWTALSHFNTAQSAEVFFADVSQDVPPVTVVPLTKIVNKTAKYSVTLNANTPYFVGAVIADCASNPEQCGTATVTGTHIRFNNFVTTTPNSGSITVNVIADPTNYPLDPLAICGSLSVQSGTFVKALVGAESAFTLPEQFYSVGVYSTTMVNAPATSYCVQGSHLSFSELDATVTLQQTQVPSCPAQLDQVRNDFFFMGNDPVTDNVTITVPGPPGEVSGSFTVAGFTYDDTRGNGFNSGPTLGDCAGIGGVNFGGGPGQTSSFDVNPALSGTWRFLAVAERHLLSPDSVLDIRESATPMSGSEMIAVNVPPGGSAAAPLTFTPGVLAGNITHDLRRLGAVTNPPAFSTYEGIPNNNSNEVVGSGWTPSVRVATPMQFTERYELRLDPRGQNWIMRAVDNSTNNFGYDFSTGTESASSGWTFVALPSRFGPPSVQSDGNIGVPIGNVTAGAISADVPAIDFRVANVTLNAPAGFTSISWSAGNGQNAPNGLFLVNTSLNASTFDGSPAVGRMNAPPAQYAGTTTVTDSNFNSLTDPRQLDLAPDDDLTADFGAPALLAVRPLPGAPGGAPTVTGTVTTSAPPVTVKVNGVNASVTGTSFSLGTTIGTGPLTIVARDNLGRTTTLKRYFTTITGLFAPAAGADLVSQNADLYAVEGANFIQPALPPSSFQAGSTIPLKLAGSLAGAPVTATNAAVAPKIIALELVIPGAAPARPGQGPGGQTVFHFDASSGLWVCTLSTQGLPTGTYVVPIQFWDGRILEAAFVLS
jgi:hypothetical protein